MLRRIGPLALTVIGLGCAATRPSPARTEHPAEAMPHGAPREPLAWATFDAETFARAKAEHRFVVLDGAAEWCHWCHVMEATTYHDPVVQMILAKHFIIAKVDVDERPDIEERYGAWGWPATVLFSPDGTELGKYKGYIEPHAFADVLRGVVSRANEGPDPTVAPEDLDPDATPLSEAHIAWIARATEVELAEYWDEAQGSWGHGQKVPLYWDNAWTLERARAGDAEARNKALMALEKQAQIIDPVWGGIYQYSTDGNWLHPHFEKLTLFQAGALDNYAAAYALTGDRKWLLAAKSIATFLEGFMLGPEGTFYATMDADLNAHDASKPFLNGHDYYAQGDAQRRALGVPRIDTHDYARENGFTLAAYVRLYEATHDARALAIAANAARRVAESHRTNRGAVTHERGAERDAPIYLADNAAFGWGLMRLYQATRDPVWLEQARPIARFLGKELFDEKAGGFWSMTPDPSAVGVFAKRRKPFEENVVAVRFLAALAKEGPNETLRKLIAATLAAIATPEQIKDRGRMLGDFLLALSETKGVR